MKVLAYSVLPLIFMIGCRNTLGYENRRAFDMNDKQADSDKVSVILEKLNWWVVQTYNPNTGEIESTGEAQAAIKNYMELLDNMHVQYSFENGQYILRGN